MPLIADAPTSSNVANGEDSWTQPEHETALGAVEDRKEAIAVSHNGWSRQTVEVRQDIFVVLGIGWHYDRTEKQR